MFIALGIETSCDDTAAAVVRGDGLVLSSVVSSQTDLHRDLGGVVPEIASRAHLELILPAIREALAGAGVSLAGIGGIAVTAGPGLVGALLVGVQAAKSMGWSSGIPVVGVHHLLGHMAAPFLLGGPPEDAEPPRRPYVVLIASGGHTSLVAVAESGASTVMGRTRDDAAGEALDKGAKLLGLPYPGGPAIEKEASTWDGSTIPPFPRGLRPGDNLDFSFSGVKTALADRIRSLAGDARLPGHRAALAQAYQQAIVDSLVTKAVRACEVAGIRRLVLCGGVAANSRLRAEMSRRAGASCIELHVPRPQYCTDNAAMIAMAGMDKLARGVDETFAITASPGLALPQ